MWASAWLVYYVQRNGHVSVHQSLVLLSVLHHVRFSANVNVRYCTVGYESVSLTQLTATSYAHYRGESDFPVSSESLYSPTFAKSLTPCSASCNVVYQL